MEAVKKEAGGQALADVPTPGHGQGEGTARYESRTSGTKEIAGGAGVSEANGVPSGPDCPPDGLEPCPN